MGALRFSPKQRQVLTWWREGSPHWEKSAIICDGAVRSGKTLCLGLSFFLWARARFQGRRFALCGRSMEGVRRNLTGEVLPLLRGMGFQCREQLTRGEVTVSLGRRRNIFCLFGGGDEGAAACIQGVTLAGALLDEAVLMPRSFVEQCCARCSVQGARLWFSCLGRDRLALVMETICAAGIRVSEVRYITVEAARSGQADIALKGKVRTILLPGKLCRKLLKYARQQKTASGEIFLTKSGKPLSRRQIWAEMKRLCLRAGVAPTKVFPHNLRHLFARTFYQATRDVAKLADVLGHSSIETTRIYLISTGAQHRRDLDRLRLVC